MPKYKNPKKIIARGKCKIKNLLLIKLIFLIFLISYGFKFRYLVLFVTPKFLNLQYLFGQTYKHNVFYVIFV